ncbi:hypothetical protein CDAR_218201 [Caerostris darwini]|uniref:Uncharacterized protein n=1 Tax=Caerostris darwini TaxID=1538125 RepID=A0AAV4RAB5_9ARAC|nr:hypothetical protein CDAR_218201 [Caerostris darwini]
MDGDYGGTNKDVKKVESRSLLDFEMVIYAYFKMCRNLKENNSEQPQSHNYHSNLIPITNKSTIDFLQTIPKRKEEEKKNITYHPQHPNKSGGGGEPFFLSRISREIRPAAYTETQGHGKPITRNVLSVGYFQKQPESHNNRSNLIPMTNKGAVDFLQTIPKTKKDRKRTSRTTPQHPNNSGGGKAFFRSRISLEMGPAACSNGKTQGNGKPINRKHPLQGDEPESISLGATVR